MAVYVIGKTHARNGLISRSSVTRPELAQGLLNRTRRAVTGRCGCESGRLGGCAAKQTLFISSSAGIRRWFNRRPICRLRVDFSFVQDKKSEFGPDIVVRAIQDSFAAPSTWEKSRAVPHNRQGTPAAWRILFLLITSFKSLHNLADIRSPHQDLACNLVSRQISPLVRLVQRGKEPVSQVVSTAAAVDVLPEAGKYWLPAGLPTVATCRSFSARRLGGLRAWFAGRRRGHGGRRRPGCARLRPGA